MFDEEYSIHLPYPKLKTEITNQKNKPACVGLSHVPSRSSYNVFYTPSF